MADFNLGSISVRAYDRLNDVPTSISGAVMNEIAYQALLFANNYLKTSIGSNTISDAYQSPIISLTCAWTLARMEQIGADFNWSLGEFRVDRGGYSSNADLVQSFFDQGMMELKFIGRPLRFVKANG